MNLPDCLFDKESLISELTEFFGTFDPLLWDLEAGTEKEFNKLKSHDQESLSNYYRNEIGFVYQSAWNCATNDEKSKYTAILNYVKAHNYKNIIDYGFGIGTGLIMIANEIEDAKCVGCDICKPNIDFLNYRIKKYNLNNLFVVDLMNWDWPLHSRNVDCIICTEVFEHVEDPITLAKQFYESLNTGGALIASWSFVPMPTHVAENFYLQEKHPDDITKEGFSKELINIGFKFVGNSWFNNWIFEKGL